MTRRHHSWAALVAVLAVATTGIAIPAATQAKKVTLRLAHWGANPANTATVNLWNKLNPNIQVRIEAVDWGSYFQKIPVEIAAGTPPDIFSELAVNGKFWPLAKKKILRDLTPYFRSDMNMKDFFPSALDAASFSDKIYGMPVGISNSGFLYYNLSLFDQRGLTYPDASWTVGDFNEAAKKLTKDTNNDGKMEVFGFSGFGNIMQLFDQVLCAGGRIYNEAGTKMALDSSESARVLRWRLDIQTQYKVVGGDYASGKAAMYAGSPQWVLNAMTGIKGKFRTGAALWPKDSVTGVRKFESDPWHLCVPSNGKNFKEAWQFLKWFNTKTAYPTASRDAFGLSQLVPPLKSVARSDVYLKPNPAMVPSSFDLSVIVDGVDTYTYSPQQVNNGYDIRAMMADQFGKLMAGRFSIEQFIAKVNQEGNILLNRNKDRK